MAPSAEEPRGTGQARPSLAVCIPTHDGRKATLTELLERLVPQIPEDGSVEVCVSDNGSSDGTQELVTSQREQLGDRLRYRRSERNLGLMANLFGVIELATAEYCWFLSSDDLPAPGAVDRIIGLLDDHPGIAGMHVGFARRLSRDMGHAGAGFPPEFSPHSGKPVPIRGVDAFCESCGMLTLPLSCNVVDRDRWCAVVAEESEIAARAPLVPQIYVIGRMVEQDPSWLWSGEWLTWWREAPGFPSEEDEIGPDDGMQMAALTADIDHVWAQLHGRGSRRHRLMMARFLQCMWHPAAAAVFKTHSRGGPGQWFRFAALTRHFWWSGEFRRRILPLLLAPWSWLQPRQPPASHPPPLRTQLSGRLTSPLTPAQGTWVDVLVENTGAVSLSFGRPNHLALKSSWTSRETGEEDEAPAVSTPLFPPLRPRGRRPLRHLATVPNKPGSYELSIDLVSLPGGWSATGETPLRFTVEVPA